MITTVVQRWRDRRDSYRPAREVADVARFDVEPEVRMTRRDLVEVSEVTGQRVARLYAPSRAELDRIGDEAREVAEMASERSERT